MSFTVMEYFDTGALVEGNFDPVHSLRDAGVIGEARPLIGGGELSLKI